MKKTFWSLAALMLMAAPVMTSCSNDLDEVAPVDEAKSNVVTITIAPPAAETRIAMNSDLVITGWEVDDVVTLYKATEGQKSDPQQGIWDDIPAKITGTGVAFTCTNASGTFSGTLPDGEDIEDYNLAIFGGTAENGSDGIKISPTSWSSTDLKDVIMMGALKDSEGKFTMQVINNVLKIENTTASDVDVAWYGYDYMPSTNNDHYFELSCLLGTTRNETWRWYGTRINSYDNPTWADVPHFTLAKSAVNYVNLPMLNGYANQDKIGLYTQDGTAVVEMKGISGRVSNTAQVYCGHLLDAGTY